MNLLQTLVGGNLSFLGLTPPPSSTEASPITANGLKARRERKRPSSTTLNDVTARRYRTHDRELLWEPRPVLPSRPSPPLVTPAPDSSVSAAPEKAEEPGKTTLWAPAFLQAEETCGPMRVGTVTPLMSSLRGWKTVRVFVSSTFADMHSERECLVKRVFPVLRKWCSERRLHLVECDLRWGVPKDSASGDTLRVCLGELDRCISENGHPFFVSLLGGRCGWIPTHDQVPPAIQARYHWIDGFSVTGMEILHGVCRTRTPNAVFMLRDPSLISRLPREILPQFKEDTAEHNEFVDQLRRKVRSWFPASCFDYSCTFSHVGADGKPVMINMEDFEATVLNFLKTSISQQYPEDHISPEPVLLAKLPHTSMLENKTRLCVHDTTGSVQLALSSLRDSHPAIIQITGSAGSGKSTLLSEIEQEVLKDSKWKVLVHFAGAGPGSKTSMNLLRRICMEWGGLKRLEGEEDSIHSIAMGVIGKLSKLPKKFLLCIDDIDTLESSDHPVPDWWLSNWPNVSIMFTSCGPFTFAFPKMKVTSTIRAQCHKAEEIISTHLRESNKQLDSEQMRLLIEKYDAQQSPLYLVLACEELRVFGIFEQVTTFIRNMSPTIPGLLKQIYNRIKGENSAVAVDNFLGILTHCPESLYEPEMQMALGISPSEFVSLRQSLSVFLAKSAEGSSLTFAHSLFKKVFSSIVPKACLTLVATLFESDQVEPTRRARVLPVILLEMQEKDRLARCLSLWETFDFWYNDETKYTLYKFWYATAKDDSMAKLYHATLDKMTSVEKEDLAYRYFRVGELMYYLARYDDGLSFATTSQAMSEPFHFGFNVTHAYALNLLGRLYEKKGEIDLSEANHKKSLEIKRKTRGCPPDLIAHSLNNLAGLYFHHGKRHWDSLPLYKEALAILKKLYGDQHVDIADVTSNMGQVYYDMGKLEEAVQLYEQTIEMRKRL
ncbi:telomerase protein component 1 [Pelomyxa schiedti]|nr:telomerase protein component 1 [Pelomyxa schiedti]